LTTVPAGIRRGCHHHRVAGDRVGSPQGRGSTSIPTARSRSDSESWRPWRRSQRSCPWNRER